MTSTLVEPDFGGYATKFGIRCTDGRTITPAAFQHMDGQQIPLVWQHQHNSPENVLGHAVLKHRDDGTYASGFLNDTPAGQATKALLLHKDVDSLSIYANQLVEKNNMVLHGQLIEVSVVMKGANSGAKIDHVRIAHSDGGIEELDDEAIIHSGVPIEIKLEHASGGPTYQEVFDSLNDQQQQLVEFMVAQALQDQTAKHSADDKHAATEDDGKKSDEDAKDAKDEKTEDKDSVVEHSDKDGKMTRNVFEQNQQNAGGGVQNGGTLRHSLTGEQLDNLKHSVFADLKRGGTFKDAVLAHAGEYGITNIEVLFPDAQTVDNKPEWITRRMEWVDTVIGATNKLPFSRIKSMHADLTQDEARAKGYIKTKMKKEQFFAITSRTTTPKTIYKKQKLDRDDIVDITDFDVVAWIWSEMRFMLREEIARAILIGDGREVDDDDKIDETAVRPIAFDDTFYTDVINVPANVSGQDMVDSVLRSRQYYKGTAPTAYMTTAVLMDMLLTRNSIGERIYRTKQELASALAVQDIVEVPVMENASRDGAEIQMVIVNLGDYSVGSTRGGEITTFDDFDIDYNQYKYLIEGRMSGALTKAKTAQVVTRGSGTQAIPTVPTFNDSTGVITIPTVAGVTYKTQVAGPLGAAGTTLAAGAQTALTTGQSQAIMAVPNTGYYFPHNTDADWTFTKS
jgi:HK97 family phage prohead protease